MKAPIPANEDARLEALRQHRILDTPPESAYDDITRLTAFICSTPIAIMTFVDRDRQWFKSKVGLDTTETKRDRAFCAHTILQPKMLVVEDALEDARFSDNPLVTSAPHIRFYAGAPLITKEGFGLGSLCVIDRQPRQLDAEQAAALQALARMVVTQMELRRVSRALAEATEELKTLGGLLPICAWCKNIRNDHGYWQQVEAYFQAHTEAKFTHCICPDCARKLLQENGPGPAAKS